MNKYFVHLTDVQGSCYYEFFNGTYDKKKMPCWNKQSLYITDIDWEDTGFEALVQKVVNRYDQYGYTPITKEEWNTILQQAEQAGGKLWVAVSEVADWAKQNFFRHKVFTILGM